MPHFGLMDENLMGPVEGPLQRARLHIRAGKRRLRQGKVSSGIVTLYDALLNAMKWYFSSPEKRRGLTIADDADLTDDRKLFEILTASGVLDGSFDYIEFDRLVETALEKAMEDEMRDYDYREVLAGIEHVMTRLGVMPFDENALPPEDPSTY